MMPEVVSPESRNDAGKTDQPINWWTLFWSVVLVSLSALIYLAIFLLGPRYENLYQGFGVLPTLTTYVLASYRYCGVLVLVGLIPCVTLFKNRNGFAGNADGLVAWVVVGFGLALSALAVFALAMYWPIFEMGSVVG